MVFTIVLPIFAINIGASQITTTDDLFIGSLINASQGGQSKGRSVNVERLGNHVIGGQRDAGRRLGTTPKRGGNNIAWNPSKVDIDVLYNDYVGYVQESGFGDDIYIVPLNKTYQKAKNSLTNSKLKNGFIVEMPENTLEFPAVHLYDVISIPKRYDYLHVVTTAIDTTKPLDWRRFVPAYSGGYYFYDAGSSIQHDITDFPNVRTLFIDYDDANAFRVNIDSVSREIESWNVSYIYFSDYRSATMEHVDIIHNSANLPTKQQFIDNYTSTFNVQYDNNTNQLVENNNYFTYNINDFSDNSITVNNSYVTNNYITIYDSETGDDLPEQLNYTSFFERMINAIKDLPQQIRDKFDDFSGGGTNTEPEPVEEGKGFWSSLFDAISSIVSAFSDFITSVPQLILDLLDGLLGLVEKIVELFIPTSEQMQELSDSFSGLTDDVTLKFSPVTETIGSINTVFSSPKSIYDLTYNVQGQTVNVIPRQLEVEINKFKAFLNGVLVLTTFISIYKRFVGREDVIK